jgi:phage protein D
MPPRVLEHVPLVIIELEGQRLPRAYVSQLSELTVDEREDHSTEITWRVMPIDGASKMEADDPYVKERSRVRLRFGWIGQLSRTHECSVIAIETTFDARGMSRLVKLRDHALRLQGKQTRRAHAGTTIAGVVIDVARRCGLHPYLPSVTGALRLSTNPRDPNLPAELRTTVSDVQAGLNDQKMLARLARRIDYRVRIEGDRLYFEGPDYARTATRDYVWRHGRGLLFSFRPTSNAAHPQLGPGIETTAIGVDTAKKQKVEARANEDSQKGRPVLGKGSFHVDKVSGSERWQPDTTGLVLPHPSSDKALLEDHARDLRARAEVAAVQASAEVYGNPLLGRGDVIRILGVGRQNSGHWRVVACRHQIGVGGFKTTVAVVRHGHASADKRSPKTTGKVNESRPGQAERAAKVVVDIVTGKERLVR